MGKGYNPGNGRHEYDNVTFPARSDIPLSTHTLDALPRVQYARCVQEDRGVMYGARGSNTEKTLEDQ